MLTEGSLTRVVGLDVGGAHLKVAVAEGGRLVAVAQHVCPLWQGLAHLDAALAAASPLTAGAARTAVTMTGELSDLFASRREGVATLVARLSAALGADTRFWMGARGFGSADQATLSPELTGSTNFLATAALAGRRCADALLVDLGSTTTDIVPVTGGRPVPLGLTDAERQATGELVYTGFTRTAVMAVAGRAPFAGQWVTLAREYLATMADARRVLGTDLEAVDLHATADGRGKSVAESRQRLARMLGRDACDSDPDAWLPTAAYLRERQLCSIVDGCLQVLSRAAFDAEPTVITAGIGADDAAEVARRLGLMSQPFGALTGAPDALQLEATRSAPAAAVALLASDLGQRSRPPNWPLVPV